jgi:hypothetical protein
MRLLLPSMNRRVSRTIYLDMPPVENAGHDGDRETPPKL